MLATAALLALAGCRSEDPPPAGAPPEAATSAAPAAGGAPEAPGATGTSPAAPGTSTAPPPPPAAPVPAALDDPANDPAIAAAARAVAACVPAPGLARVDSAACPALIELERAVGRAAPAAAFDTLLRLTAAPGPVLPAAAADLLRQRTWPRAVTSDDPRLARLLGALGESRDAVVAEGLGTAAGGFRPEGDRRRRELLGRLRDHPLPAARKGLLAHLLFTSGDLPGVFEAVRDAAETDPSPAVRSAALAAFWNLGEERRADIVPIWTRALRTPEPIVAAKAAYLLGHWRQGVAEAFPEVVAETRRRAAEGRVTWDFLSGLLWYVRNGQPFVDRAAVFDAARAVLADERNGWMARNKALDLMELSGGEGFPPAARPYADDPEPLVAAHARKLLGAARN